MMRYAWIVILVVAGIAAIIPMFAVGAPATQKSALDLEKEFQKGNYKDAYDGLSPLVLGAERFEKLDADFELCVQSLSNLGREDEVDAFRDKAIAAHAKDWRFLWTAAKSLRDGQHFGAIVAGNFYRGNRRSGDGKWVDSVDRDRTQALQLMVQAMGLMDKARDAQGIDQLGPLEDKKPTADEQGHFYQDLADTLIQGSNGPDAWRLQFLTDLAQLPDYQEAARYYRGWGGWEPSRGAPVDAKGNPIFHALPKDWAGAISDGQRWRWALMQSAEASAAFAAEAHWRWALFLNSQFGVQTMAEYGALFRENAGGGKKDESGPYAVYTLKDNETIAKLATGIKRFALPDEYNPIKVLQAMAADTATDKVFESGDCAESCLASIYEDRQQYDTAADWLKKAIARFPNAANYKPRLDQVLGNWGQFENTLVQPAGDAGAKIDFRFRNAQKIHFSAHEVDVAKLLEDVKAAIRQKPKTLDWETIDISNIGWRLVERDQKQYIGKQAATWDMELKPRPGHFDAMITVDTPLKKAGAYLLEGTLDHGNTSRIIVWIADTVIVRKTLSDANYDFVADAVTGQPIAGAKLDFFGYQQQWVQNQTYRINIAEFSADADADGQVKATEAQMPANMQWITSAGTKDGRFAFTGFSNIWYQHYQDLYDQQYNQTKAFFMTDRPVYRPGQKVDWKVWVGKNQYDKDGQSPFAGKTVTVVMVSPRGEKFKTVSGTLDEWGGLSGDLTLENEATLGVYSVQALLDGRGIGGSSFRVEEYKKPEYEVKIDAPTEPAMLGETVTATVKANYYFGAPVVNAKVKYKVTRTAYHESWYPPARWDWFYEPGYWWFEADYSWYPGFNEWGMMRPVHSWWPGPWSNQQPEVVLDGEAPIGADGTLKIDIDTAIAKAAYGDQDHKYEITAEVTDASRRTIVGTGQVLVARQPFKVYAWTDKGYYHTGDPIEVHYSVLTLDNKPVTAAGTIHLMKITYDKDAKPVETDVTGANVGWDMAPTENMQHTFKAAEAGQYRVKIGAGDGHGHSAEGGYIFTVRGEGFDGKDFRFNDIEITTDKKEYAAGDKVKLLINANRPDSTILLFLRPTNGIYLAPKVIRMKGKSDVEEIEVGKKDMPNFFIEALTVSNAHVFTDVREVIVPPEDRILNVAVTSDAPEYKPGSKAKLTVKVTEKNGEPFTGAAVLSLYDKSVEYISGGSNITDIRKYFWQWRRQHSVQGESSLDKSSGNIVKSGEIPMRFLGAFGAMATEYGLNISGGTVLRQESRRDLAGNRGSNMMAAAAPARAMFSVEKEQASGGEDKSDAPADGAAPGVAPTVRQNFADTAFWAPSLVTAKDGIATVEVPMPENLTTWRAKVWALGNGTRVGQGDTDIITTKKLIVRLEAPRFFVETDEVVLSAIVHNYLKTKENVRVELKVPSEQFELLSPAADISNNTNIHTTMRRVDVDPQGEARLDWRVKVVREGMATIALSAITDVESDALQQTFPVYVHGMLKMASFSGAIRDKENSAIVNLDVPKDRRPEQSRLEVRYSPTLAGAMVDALPYLVDYPYGCTEQTLNRFVPTVITQKVLLDMKLDLPAIEKKRTNLNAQQIGDDAKRAQDWGRMNAEFGVPSAELKNPVFDQEEVVKMVREGVTRLSNMQMPDGGWGWFTGVGEQSYPHETAVVVHGLQIAKANGASVDAPLLQRGVDWLKKYQAQQIQWLKNYDLHKDDKAWHGPMKEHADEIDAFVFMVLIDSDVADPAMKDYLYRDRTKIAVYAKAMFGLALSRIKDEQKLNMILDNIRQYVVEDNEDQTAYLKMPADGWWWWYNSELEADAYYLKLLAVTDPKGQTASRLAKFLINNRKHATYWNSTRDTADCIEALADYLRASGEAAPDMTVKIALDGKQVKEVKITPQDLFTFDNKFVLEGPAITDGAHKLEVSREGTGPLYFNAYLTNFTMEKHITAAGLEIKVNRKIYLLTPAAKTVKAEGDRGQVVDEKVEKYVRTELPDGASVKSGDLVEVELEVDSKNDYEYIVIEDMKPAGFEPVEIRSGYDGNDMGAYVEFRDNRVDFFVRSLGLGKHSVSYRLRAEVPGSIHALPAKASAMYAPELKANSDEIRLQVADDAPAAK